MEHSPTSGLHYLTVQDVLWIHLRLLKTARAFRYAALEEAVNTQYAYGESKDLQAQAARFVIGFSKRAPFDAGNDPAAFVATLAFLLLNGKALTLPDSEGANWYEKVRSGAVQPEKAIEIAVGEGASAHGPASVEDAVKQIFATFPATLATLVGTDAAATA